MTEQPTTPDVDDEVDEDTPDEDAADELVIEETVEVEPYPGTGGPQDDGTD